jgi:hypothetical protein
VRRNNFLPEKTIFSFDAELRKRRIVTNWPIKTAPATANTGDSQMRSLSFFLAFAFVLGGPTLAGTSDGGLPGIGTFGYQASPTLIAASVLVVATH